MSTREREVNVNALDELLVHAARHLFPARLRGPARGVPTAWSVPPLSGRLAHLDEDPLVWPDPEGSSRGIALEPIRSSVPAAARVSAGRRRRPSMSTDWAGSPLGAISGRSSKALPLEEGGAARADVIAGRWRSIARSGP